MVRPDDLYGKKDPDALFRGKPMAMVPWPAAGRRKDVKDYDENAVHAALRARQEPEPVDPRTLRSTQPNVTHAGVKHYLENTTGETYKDQHQAGNRNPVVYSRNGQNLVLSGHHRATAALLQGQQFNAVVVRGDWGPPR